jgi:ribosomal protein S18 acetylase RimI-like enzyme
MHVTVLGPADAPRYRSLMLHAYEHAADAFTSTPEERAAEPENWWVRRIADPANTRAAFGAFDRQQLIGTVALEFSSKPKTKHNALMLGMYVLPTFRRNGAAKALLQAAIDCCDSRGDIRSIKLTVTEGNEPAIALYRAFGFEVFGIEPMAIHTPSGFKAKVHMWKSIASGSAAT